MNIDELYKFICHNKNEVINHMTSTLNIKNNNFDVSITIEDSYQITCRFTHHILSDYVLRVDTKFEVFSNFIDIDAEDKLTNILRRIYNIGLILN